ncbi:MAG: hypothetical protein RhofKO_00500 [Rhodothermales bacterium]
MDKNRIGLLSGVLLGLLLLAWLAGAFDSAPSTLDVPDLGLADADITVVTLNQDGEIVTAERGAGIWRLTAPEDRLADSTIVARFVETVQAIELGEVVSTNPERYAKFSVDSSAAQVQITTADGDETTLFVGRPGSDFRSAYVRLADDPRVFLTTDRLTLPTDFTTWRDKTIFSLDPSQVQRVRVTTPDHAYTLEGTAQGWQIDGAAADSATVMQWLLRFAPVSADGFAVNAIAQTVRDAPTHRIELTQTDGTTYALAMQNVDGAFVTAQPGDEDVYRINNFRITNLAPAPATLLVAE